MEVEGAEGFGGGFARAHLGDLPVELGPPGVPVGLMPQCGQVDAEPCQGCLLLAEVDRRVAGGAVACGVVAGGAVACGVVACGAVACGVVACRTVLGRTVLGPPCGRAVAALRARALAEPDPLVAAVMVGGVAVRAAEGSADCLYGAADWLYGALSPAYSSGVRAAAAWGIARAGQPWTPEAGDAVAEAWSHGDVLNGDVLAGEEWRWSDSPLAESLAAMDDPERAAGICLRLARLEDEDAAERGVLAALDLLEEHPSAHSVFAPLVAAVRAHPHAGIASYADDLDELQPG